MPTVNKSLGTKLNVRSKTWEMGLNNLSDMCCILKITSP